MPEHNHPNLVVCHACDRIVDISSIPMGKRVVCPDCGHVLRPAKIAKPEEIASIAFAGIILLICALLQPFMGIGAMGIESKITLFSIFLSLQTDWTALLWIFLLVTFVCPCIMLCQLIAYGWFGYRPGKNGAELYQVCHHTSMVDVFALGVLVSLVKLVAMAKVDYYGGFFCGLAFSYLLIWCSLKCPPHRFWDLYHKEKIAPEHAGKRAIDVGVLVCRNCGCAFDSPEESAVCPRCAARVHRRNYQWKQKTLALLIASLFLFLPANLYPIMFTNFLGAVEGSNIVEGAILLWQLGSHFIAAVIIIASLMIPTFKIVMMFVLIWVVHKHRVKNRRLLSRAYRVVEFVGKWSMIDVFVVILMSAVVQIKNVINIFPGFAVICFCAVVLITIAAAQNFDERLLWDKDHA